MILKNSNSLKWFSQFSRRTRSNRSLFPKTSFLITKISGRRCDWLFDKSVYKACAKNRVIHFSRKIDTKCGNTVLGLTTGWLVSLVLSGQGMSRLRSLWFTSLIIGCSTLSLENFNQRSNYTVHRRGKGNLKLERNFWRAISIT